MAVPCNNLGVGGTEIEFMNPRRICVDHPQTQQRSVGVVIGWSGQPVGGVQVAQSAASHSAAPGKNRQKAAIIVQPEISQVDDLVGIKPRAIWPIVMQCG
jgi:hypothetical protein